MVTWLMAGLLQCCGDWGQQELLLSGGTCLIVLQGNGDWGQLRAQEIMHQTFCEFDTTHEFDHSSLQGRSLEQSP